MNESGKVDHLWYVEMVHDETGFRISKTMVIAPTIGEALEKARNDFESVYPHHADMYMIGSVYDHGAIQ